MKTLTFNLKNNLSVLHDELQAAFPNLHPAPRADGRIDAVSGEVQYEAAMMIEGIGDSVTLTVPQDTDDDAIRVVIEAHDHTQVQPDPQRDRRIRIAELNKVSKWSEDELRELVGLLVEEVGRA